MGLLDAVKRVFGRTEATRRAGAAHHDQGGEQTAAAAARVPEVTSTDLLTEMQNGNRDKILLLDIREHFERAQSLIPDSLHIPMNSLPSRLAELDPASDIVVYCAHGNRSYGVTGWMIQRGYKARSLAGGIVDWQHKQGPVELGHVRRS